MCMSSKFADKNLLMNRRNLFGHKGLARGIYSNNTRAPFFAVIHNDFLGTENPSKIDEIPYMGTVSFFPNMKLMKLTM